MNVIDTLKLIAFNLLQNTDSIAFRGRKLIVNIDE